MAQQFLGSSISLISKSDVRITPLQARSHAAVLTLLRLATQIRYQGILHSIDPGEATVSLEKVRSLGTEGRKGNPAEEIPPNDTVYDFVVFRASDVKDLKIESPAEPTYQQPPPINDPAIVATAPLAPAAQLSPIQQNQQRPPFPQHPSQQQPNQNPQYNPQFQQQQQYNPNNNYGPGGPPPPNFPPYGYNHFGPPGPFGPPSYGPGPGMGFPGQQQSFGQQQQYPPPPGATSPGINSNYGAAPSPMVQNSDQPQRLAPATSGAPPPAKLAPTSATVASQSTPNDPPAKMNPLPSAHSQTQPQPPTAVSATAPKTNGVPPPQTSAPLTSPPAPSAKPAISIPAPASVPAPAPVPVQAVPVKPRSYANPGPPLPVASAPSASAATAKAGVNGGVATSTTTAAAPAVKKDVNVSDVEKLAKGLSRAGLGGGPAQQGRQRQPAQTQNPTNANNEGISVFGLAPNASGRRAGQGQVQPLGGPNRALHPFGQAPTVALAVPTVDFDFVSSTANFKKDLVAVDTEAEEVVIPSKPEMFYDKKSSFFDSISSDIKTRAESGGAPIRNFDRGAERSRNMDTFGESMNVGAGAGGFRRRGGGERRGRGGGGGGGGGYDQNQDQSQGQRS